MSVIRPSAKPLQHFFRSAPLPCPYLPGNIERKLFTRLSGPDGAKLNSTLGRAGFRRSHDIIYRPVCTTCDACVPVRIPAMDFEWSRSMRRVARVNNDLTARIRPAELTHEQFRLFAYYQQVRHADSDMARMSVSDYQAMVEEGSTDTMIVELRSPEDELVGAILVDRMDDGLSAVYSFYDPDAVNRSLGTYLILHLVQYARQEFLPYVYLGYWVDGSQKMDYKVRFRPLEGLGALGWQPIADVLRERPPPIRRRNA